MVHDHRQRLASVFDVPRINNGETVMTSRIYPDPLSTSVGLFSEGGAVNLIKLESWTLKDIWR